MVYFSEIWKRLLESYLSLWLKQRVLLFCQQGMYKGSSAENHLFLFVLSKSRKQFNQILAHETTLVVFKYWYWVVSLKLWPLFWVFHQPRWKISCVFICKKCCGLFWSAQCYKFTSQNWFANWWKIVPIFQNLRHCKLFIYGQFSFNVFGLTAFFNNLEWNSFLPFHLLHLLNTLDSSPSCWIHRPRSFSFVIFMLFMLALRILAILQNKTVPAGWPGYVFVRNLARQLGTPSPWQSVNTCKEGQMGALAAVCTPTLKSASKKHQKLYTPYRSTVDGTPEVVKGTVYCVYFLLLANNLSLVPCA